MRNFFIALLVITGVGTSAQTIFSYGTNQVSKNEFWRAYSKNNNGERSEKLMREYLDLYIRFKLKVQAAKDAKLDTLPNIKNDIAGFRAQLIEQYLRNQSYSKSLVTEAANRNQYELEIAHVFVAYNADSAAAKVQIEKAYKALQGGADFSKTSHGFSNNEFVKNTNGYIGYISVFSLPYTFENVVYALTPGTFSKPIAGAKGWHIFKLLQKRNSAGKMKASQILFAIPQNANADEKAEAKKLADSVYKLLLNGESFEAAALTYSTDKLTYSTGGLMQEFTYTTYEEAFSKAAFSLKKDKDISQPVLSSIGWHIIQRNSLTPVKEDLTNADVLQYWSDKVNNDQRITFAMEKMKEEMKKTSGYKALPYNEQQLWTLTDTMLNAKNYVSFFKANKQKPLFQLTGKTISVAEWLQYAKSQRTTPNQTVKPVYKTLMQQFTNETIEQYYKDRLENINEDFKYQIKEFTEGSLLFEVMERNIWSKAPTDSAGLINYYKAHKSNYKWQPSVSAIVFNCSDTATANEALRMMKQNPMRWKEYMDNMGGKALADSGRFEYAQLPIKPGTVLSAGLFTPVEVNINDGSSSFCFIVKSFPDADQRSYDEAKGLVINDYQLLLEDKWVNQLKKKYPIKVNELVVKGLGK